MQQKNPIDSKNVDNGAGPETSKGPGMELMSVETLVGNDVYDFQGGYMVDIGDMMLDMRRGRVDYVVVSFAAFLGMGEKLFAVPRAALTFDTENKRLTLSAEKDRLKEAPGFDKRHWPNMADQTWRKRDS